jgi:hypothetical protein
LPGAAPYPGACFRPIQRSKLASATRRSAALTLQWLGPASGLAAFAGALRNTARADLMVAPPARSLPQAGFFTGSLGWRSLSLNRRDYSTSLVGTNRRLEDGQSMSALPGYFRHQPVPQLPRRHRPRCEDIGLCFQSWYARARAGQPSGCTPADKSAWLSCVAANASQTALGQARRFRSTLRRAVRSETRRAYWRVVMFRAGPRRPRLLRAAPRRPGNKNSPGRLPVAFR